MSDHIVVVIWVINLFCAVLLCRHYYVDILLRDITLPENVCIVKATILPEIVSGCESWTIKKPEYQRIDAFKL